MKLMAWIREAIADLTLILRCLVVFFRTRLIAQNQCISGKPRILQKPQYMAFFKEKAHN
jgi:hypothetical protein